MKKIVVCDSGLGGLNIASHFFRVPDAEPCELIYFNAYPALGHGFNKLPDERAKEDLFRKVLTGMERFSPDLCLIACNTLSIVYESLRQYYTPPFPVDVIIEDAVSGMCETLRKNPSSSLLILGTQTTVDSGLYQKRILQKQFSSERIRGLACPGFATLLETDPAAPEIREQIRRYAETAAALFKQRPEELLLALCCTHFEYAGNTWKDCFSEVFGIPVSVINPNDRMKTSFSARDFHYHTRTGFVPGARENMVRYFRNGFPEIALALEKSEPDLSLFEFELKQ